MRHRPAIKCLINNKPQIFVVGNKSYRFIVSARNIASNYVDEFKNNHPEAKNVIPWNVKK